jgi:WD40 repeat protein
VSGSGDDDDTVRLWDTRTGKCISTIIQWHDSVWALDISPDGKELLLGGKNNPPEIWDFETRRLKVSLQGGTCRDGRFSPNGQYLAVGCSPKLWLLRSPDWESIDTLELQPESSGTFFRKVRFSSDSARVAYCARMSSYDAETTRSKLAVWNIDTSRYELEKTLSDISGMECIALSPDARTIACGLPRRIELFDASTGQTVEVFEHQGNMMCCMYSPDGVFLVGGQYQGVVYIWRLADSKLVAEIPAHTEKIADIRFSPDGRFLATCSDDKTIKIWDFAALTQPGSDDPDRRAAEWVLGIGGQVGYVPVGGEKTWTTRHEELPSQGFSLVSITVNGDAKANDAGLANLRGLAELTNVTITTSDIGDKGLEFLGGLKQLRSLTLVGNRRITDNGLKYLGELLELRILRLDNTGISDEGLRHLESLKHLALLGVGGTQVTDDGVGQLVTLPCLAVLALDARQLTRTAVTGLKNMPILVVLGVDGPELDKTDINALKDLTSLKELYFKNSRLSEQDIVDLRAALPNCKIETEDGLWDSRRVVLARELADARSATTPPLAIAHPDAPSKISPHPPAESSKPEPTSTLKPKTEKDEGDKTPKISWKLRHTLEGHTDEVISVAFHPNGKMVVSGGLDATIRFWDVESGKQIQVIGDIGGVVKSLDVSPNGSMVAGVGRFGALGLWQLPTGKPLRNTQWQVPDWCPCVTFNSDGSVVASCEDNSVVLRHLRTQKTLRWTQGASTLVCAAAFSPDSAVLASGAKDGSVKLWDTRTGVARASFIAHRAGVRCVGFSSNGLLATCSGDKDETIKLWDAATGKHRLSMSEKSNPFSLCFSPDGGLLATAGTGHGIYIWNTTTGQQQARLSGHTDAAFAVAFSPDGKLLASGSADKTVRIWEINVEQE